MRDGPAPAVAAVRVAVRRALAGLDVPGVLVACSGGADSVALAAAVAFEAPKLGLPAGLVTVDHGLQPGSADLAREVAALGRRLGLDPVRTETVTVGTTGGPEAAARTARYAALTHAAAAAAESTAEAAGPPAPGPAAPPAAGSAGPPGPGSAGPGPTGGGCGAAAGWAVLLGHTLDDQAETVLLGLGRGSGPRSVAGMRPVDGRWVRPLLGVRRATTRAACAAERLPYRDDPHNADPRFTRVRLRTEVLPLLEDVLQGGVAEALARTAELVRADLDALDALVPAPAGPELAVAELARHPAAVRRRMLRGWLGGPLTSVQLAAVDALVTRWRGQGPVHLPSGRVVSRSSGMLRLDRTGREP